MRSALFTTIAVLGLAPLLHAGTDDPHSFKASTSDEVLTDEQREDIGDIHPQGTNGLADYFYGSAQGQLQYTTNARLDGNHSSSDGIFMPSLTAGFAFPVGAGFSLDLMGRLDSALYGDNTDRALWGASVAGTVNWRPNPKWPRLYVTAEPYYFQSWEGGERLAQAIGLTAGIEHNVVLNRGYTMISGGYSFSHYFSSISLDDRNQNRFILSLTQQLHPRLYAQVYYAFQYSDYESGGRHDLRQIGGLNFTWQFTQRLFGTLNSNLVDNDSNLERAEYQSFGISAGVTFQF